MRARATGSLRQHAEDPAELRLGLARLLLLVADRRDLHQEIGGARGGVGLLGHALVEIGEAIPRAVLLRDPVAGERARRRRPAENGAPARTPVRAHRTRA